MRKSLKEKPQKSSSSWTELCLCLCLWMLNLIKNRHSLHLSAEWLQQIFSSLQLFTENSSLHLKHRPLEASYWNTDFKTYKLFKTIHSIPTGIFLINIKPTIHFFSTTFQCTATEWIVLLQWGYFSSEFSRKELHYFSRSCHSQSVVKK